MRKAIIFLVLIAIFAPLQAQPGQKTKGKSTLKLAKEHLQYEEYEDAIPYLKQLLEGDASSAYYNFWMGKSLYITYKRNQALPYLEKVEKINAEVDKEFHYYYALTLHYNLHFDRAIEQYKVDLQRYEPGSADHAYISNRIAQCLYAKKLLKKKEGEQVKITNMGPKINSEYSEHSPVVSANDSTLIYTARRPDCLGAMPDAHFYDEDVYIAQKNGPASIDWTNGVNIGLPVNSKGHDATISLTADAKRLYIYRHKKAGGLYVTDFDQEGKKWKEPVVMEKPLNSKFYEACIAQSADGNMLFFSSDRPGGFGGKDIYMVRRLSKTSWSEPVNLGSKVNTQFDEDAPFFHPDSKTLYYSSDGPNSMGGFDIFVTEMDSNAEGGWLDPLNMGYPVNTADHDIYFVLSASGKHGYYSSGKEGGFGEKDIYQLEFPYYPYPRRYFIVELNGLAHDALTLEPINARVNLLDFETGKILDSMQIGPNQDTSRYFFTLREDQKYTLEVLADGYNPTAEDIMSPKTLDEDIALEKNFFLNKPVTIVEQEKEVEKLPEFQHIYFDFDKYTIRPDAQAELKLIADYLKAHPEVSLQIKSHTDWYNTFNYNVTLSQNRAKYTRDYLLKLGIESSRLVLDNLSENKPLETNENDEGRQYNRRSEFRFVRNGETFMSSKKLKSGVEGVVVDHTTPKGQPGFDNPSGVEKATVWTPAATPQGSNTQPSSQELAMTQKLNVKPANEKLDVNPAPAKLEVKPATEPAPAAPAPAEVKPAAEADLAGVQLKNIYFDFDKFGLRTESVAELDKLWALLKKDPTLRVEIFGHTDAYGSDLYNQRLSDNRCKTALDYLLNKGISKEQAAMLGFSEFKPVDNNTSDGGRQNNRRVEFRVWKGDKIVLQSQP